MNMKIKGVPLEVRSAIRWFNASIAKIVVLQASGQDIEFRHNFNPDSKKPSEKWLIDRHLEGYKYSSYQTRLQKIASDFGFGQSEMDTLEMYLLFGGGIVSGGGSTRLQEEQKLDNFIPNSQWDTPSLYQKIEELRKKGCDYEKIAEYYNQIIKKHGLRRKKVTATRLRQVFFRGDKKVTNALNRLT